MIAYQLTFWGKKNSINHVKISLRLRHEQCLWKSIMVSFMVKDVVLLKKQDNCEASLFHP